MRTIYEPQGRAREYSALALNLYEGCLFGCDYCFNTKMPWFDEKKFRTANVRTSITSSLLECLERDCSKIAGDPREILLSFTCDPYPDRKRDIITREALLILEKYAMRVQILTKAGPAAERDFDILERNGWRYGITISGDHSTSMQHEPFAASVWDRVLSLSTAHHRRISTFVSFEPVINARFCLDLMGSKRFQAMVDEMRVGKMNYMPEIERSIDWKRFLTEARSTLQDYTGNVIYKKDLLAYESCDCEENIAEGVV